MKPGYKARSLLALDRKGLPTLDWNYTDSVNDAVMCCTRYARTHEGRWACRTDAPENTGRILPLFGSNKNFP